MSSDFPPYAPSETLGFLPDRLERLTAIIETSADLPAIAAAADQVAADLGAVLGRDDLRCQVQLKTAARTRAQPRVT